MSSGSRADTTMGREISNTMTKFQPTRVTGGVTNAQRAAWGFAPLAVFARLTGLAGEDIETCASDMLADVGHAAAALGEQDVEAFIFAIARRAADHYYAETLGDEHEGTEDPPFAEKPIGDPNDCTTWKIA